MRKFPKSLAAARQLEIDQWELGDALIEECGKPGSIPATLRGAALRDGSYALLEECSEFFASHGLPDYSVSYLAKLRNTAFEFQGRDRKTNMSWSTHQEAGSPEVLKSIIAGSPEKKITRDYVRDIRNAAETVETAEEFARARQRRPNLPEPPERSSITEPRITPAAIVGLQVIADLAKLQRELERIVGAATQDASRLGDAERDCIIRDFLAVAETARNGASIVNPSKRGRLSAVGE